ncbi:hypothetical protein HPB49_015155 [Dermacentor silvarum]|uniref:Uncharacterized protein n=1 Tax=Dermacentor silvarum TaxID=543639 RepID=A0ACB8CA35_DERSI|nr:hypothetical protein HPB49_015155 [Dermacentor silvarum]
MLGLKSVNEKTPTKKKRQKELQKVPRQAVRRAAQDGTLWRRYLFCGRSLHPRSECPARALLCNHCRKKGQFAVVCRSRKAKPTKLDTTCLHTVVVPENAKYVDVTVHNYTVAFKVDSGSEVSAVPEGFPTVPPHLSGQSGDRSRRSTASSTWIVRRPAPPARENKCPATVCSAVSLYSTTRFLSTHSTSPDS